MKNAKLTPSTILSALNTVLIWTQTSNDRDSLSYRTFEKILMCDLELISYNRTVRDKWNELVRFGFFKEVNQYSCIVDLNAVRAKLATATPQPKTPAAKLPTSIPVSEAPEVVE